MNYFYGVIKVENILKFLLLNWTTPFIGVGHLWFLLALLYVYLIIKYINKKWPIEKFYPLSFIMILFVYGLEIINTFGLVNVSQILYRNAFLMGFPLFVLGHFLRHNIQKLNMDTKKLSFVLLVLIIVWSGLSFIEFNLNCYDNCLFLSNIVLCFGLFIFAINKPFVGLFSNMGEYDSGNIYIIHYAIIVLITSFFEPTGVVKYILPFLIFIGSYGISFFYRKMKFLVNKR